jgi:hypothetical protein
MLIGIWSGMVKSTERPSDDLDLAAARMQVTSRIPAAEGAAGRAGLGTLEETKIFQDPPRFARLLQPSPKGGRVRPFKFAAASLARSFATHS